MRLWRGLAAAVLLSLAAIAAAEDIAAPAVTVQAVPRRPGGIETDDPATSKIPMALVVVNGSAREVTNFALVVDPASGFTAGALPRFPAKLAPFATFLGSFELAPRKGVAYSRHDVVLALQYRWRVENTEFSSAQPVIASVELKRLFEEEAKSLPGGTASLFYLLLPLFPAFFAYQIVDRLRRGEGVQVPVFGSDYLLPAFCIGLLVNYFFSARSRTTVLLAAAAIGAAWPALRWAWEAFQDWRWAFRTTDKEKPYLRKALLSPWTPHGHLWVTAKGGGETWSGALLAQPDGSPVLGARLQVSPAGANANAAVLQALAEATKGPTTRAQRRRLYDEVANGNATVTRVENVNRGAAAHPDIIVAEELVGFARQKVERKPFVQYTP